MKVPTKKAQQKADRLIHSAVGSLFTQQYGPSPWTLEGRKSGLFLNKEQLEWRGSRAGGACKLYSPKSRKTYCLVGFGTFIHVIDKNTFWVVGDARGRAEIVLIQLDTLKPVTNPELASKKLYDENKAFFKINGRSKMAYSFALNLASGRHPLVRTGEKPSVDPKEILYLFRTTNKTLRKEIREHETCLAVIDLTKDSVTIVPQKWFSDGRWDYGYVWLARAVRKPETKDIFIEGVRMGVAHLDKTGSKFKDWVAEYDFHAIGNLDLSEDVMLEAEDSLSSAQIKEL